MSNEHRILTVRVKCKNLICGAEHTAFILVQGGQTKKVQCPKCGWQTMQRDLNVLTIYDSVKIP